MCYVIIKGGVQHIPMIIFQFSVSKIFYLGFVIAHIPNSSPFQSTCAPMMRPVGLFSSKCLISFFFTPELKATPSILSLDIRQLIEIRFDSIS